MNRPFDIDGLIDKYYPADRKVRGILLKHSADVCALAVEIAHSRRLPLSDADIRTAAYAHDIGIIATDAPGIDCHGTMPYLAHGAVGADMLSTAGAPQWLARIAERHTGAGLTDAEIANAGLPMPPGRSYMPVTLLERLICFADCFYSKSGKMERKSTERVRAGLERFGAGVVARFDDMFREFGPLPSA